MTFEEIIGKLGEDAGVEGGYPVDEDGVVRLVFDDAFFLGLMEVESDDSLLMWSPVAELPEAGGAKLPVEILKANFFGRASAGCTLSLSDEGIVFIHCQLSLAGLEHDEFRRRLEGLVASAVEWRRIIESCRDGVQTEESVKMRHANELRSIELGGFLQV